MSRHWRRRVFGRRTAIYAWLILGLLVLLAVSLHLSSRWAFLVGLILGMTATALWMIPDALMPGHIFSWQLGAWAEETTARELKQLERKGWLVRHDVKWGQRGNHDHVIAGAAVFVLNTKNVKDSSINDRGGSRAPTASRRPRRRLPR